jgi:hypothetical protein
MIFYFPIITYSVFLQEGGTLGLGATVARKMIELHLNMPTPMFFTLHHIYYFKKDLSIGNWVLIYWNLASSSNL